MGWNFANEIGNAFLAAGLATGIGNAVVPESAKHKYNCPECGRSVWVAGGFWKGACEKCLSNSNLVGKGFQVAKGFFGM